MTEMTAHQAIPEQPIVQNKALLTAPQKAAVIIGALGAEAAGPILEQMDESSLRNFANAMSKLKKIEPELVQSTIFEFLQELEAMENTVNGGLGQARSLLEQYVNEATLSRIMDDVDMPSVHNVWRKLGKVDDQALAEFLAREHPQTAAVVLSKLSAEHAARILSRVDPDRARDIVFGITKTASLDPSVIEAIGDSVSKDFLANQRAVGSRVKPADRIGSIMNYTAGDVRQHVLSFLTETQPEFAEEVKRKMFTFEDIHERLEKRDVAAVVRGADGDDLLKALAGAADNAPQSAEYILSSISSRVAEQIRADLAEVGKVKIREAEEAQNAILKIIREMEASGELKLISEDE